jgi:hypothetical protein
MNSTDDGNMIDCSERQHTNASAAIARNCESEGSATVRREGQAEKADFSIERTDAEIVMESSLGHFAKAFPSIKQISLIVTSSSDRR